MHRRSLVPAALFGCAVLSVAGLQLIAGPLDPPSGPVAGSYKTLGEVEPRIAINATNTPGDATATYIISQPGSYYLTGNISVNGARRGILITASQVSIDLNGFQITDTPGDFVGAQAAIAGTGNLEQVTVTNGAIAGFFSGQGIALGSVTQARVERVSVVDTSGFGINCGDRAQIISCSVSWAGAAGISCGSSSIVQFCTSSNNGGNGISVGSDVVVERCTAGSNGERGIAGGTRAAVIECTVADNVLAGIEVNGYNQIRGCTSSENLFGIFFGPASLIVDNNCSYNDLEGLFTTWDDSRIEGNVLTSNASGVKVSGSGNFIARNICSGNVHNWSIDAGNALAPIVVAGTNAAAVSGNAYAGSLGSTDPNANFTY